MERHGGGFIIRVATRGSNGYRRRHRALGCKEAMDLDDAIELRDVEAAEETTSPSEANLGLG